MPSQTSLCVVKEPAMTLARGSRQASREVNGGVEDQYLLGRIEKKKSYYKTAEQDIRKEAKGKPVKKSGIDAPAPEELVNERSITDIRQLLVHSSLDTPRSRKVSSPDTHRKGETGNDGSASIKEDPVVDDETQKAKYKSS